MNIPDYLERAAKTAARNMSREELEERFVWHETQDRQMAFQSGDPEQVFELLDQANMNTHEFDDPVIKKLHLQFLDGLG